MIKVSTSIGRKMTKSMRKQTGTMANEFTFEMEGVFEIMMNMVL